MSRGLGKVQRRVLNYLDRKAKESKVTSFKTTEAYATATEMAMRLKVRLDTICQAVDSLSSQKRIRIYPNGRRRNRFYGSLILPTISEEDIFKAGKMLLNKWTEEG